MKKFALFLAFIAVTICASAQTEKGFRSFADLGYTISTSKLEVSVGNMTEKFDISSRLMATYTAGYQICPQFFVGAGVGAQYWYDSDDNTIAFPIFANVRYDQKLGEGPWGLFADARVGYTVKDINGLYAVPYVGVRYSLNEKFGVNLGVGYEIQKVKDIDGSCDGIAIKIGFDF